MRIEAPFPISSLLLLTLSFAFFYTKKPSGYLFVAPGRDKKERVEFTWCFSVYTKADSVCEVKFKERFRHQNLQNFLNGYKWFPMATKYFLVEKQYLVTYVRYIRTRWQPATRSTSCKKLKRQYLVVFCENRPHPNRLETWKYNRLITTNKTSR